MPELTTLRLPMLEAEGGGYDAVVGCGLSSLAREVALRVGDRPRFVIADENVAELHGARVLSALGNPPLLRAPAGEASKTLAEIERLAEALLDAGARRDAVLIALGGGALCDAAGFTAATLLRGVDSVYLPTTLLAMVDAAIGGKTAVNLPRGKNLVGAVHPPRLVVCDLEMLRTLSERERRAGLAEVAKHALLEGEDAVTALQDKAEALTAAELDLEALHDLVCRAVAFKGRVVAADPHERQRPPADPGPVPTAGREILNLGHTVAHALEAAALGEGRTLSHGEAVSLGLVAEARLAAAHGLWTDGPARISELLERLGLPVDDVAALQGASRDVVVRALAADKKHLDRRLRFVVLDAPGHVRALALDGDRALEILLEGSRVIF